MDERLLRDQMTADAQAWSAHQSDQNLLQAGLDRACAHCGRPFTGRHADARFCSPACKERERRARKKDGA
jgi:hypothetical protein